MTKFSYMKIFYQLEICEIFLLAKNTPDMFIIMYIRNTLYMTKFSYEDILPNMRNCSLLAKNTPDMFTIMHVVLYI